jgi:glycosyltransferase involved in cell wall biosynthesis
MNKNFDINFLNILPKVSFAFPVLNEEEDLSKCLKSIRSQNYPMEKLEIIVADGGSIDKTVEIAHRFNCKVINNPYVRAEPGAVLAHKISTGDIKVYFAADNELPHKDWVLNMVQPFIQDKEIYAAYPNIIVSKNDNSLNKYYSFLHVDPFTWYVYKDASNPLYFSRVFNISYQNSDYKVFNFEATGHPLIALAQGLCIRASFLRDQYNNEDDILPIIEIIREGKKLAFVENAGIYHFHLRNFADFIHKYSWRIQNSLNTNNVGYSSRDKYQNYERKRRKITWIFYGLMIFPALVDGVRWSIKRRSLFPLWHMPACFVLCVMIVYMVLVNYMKRLFK